MRSALAVLCILLLARSGVEAADPLPIPSHLQFVTQWFPTQADSASHTEVQRSLRLASRMAGTSCHYSKVLAHLDLIRDHVGFDQVQIERFTTATIKLANSGTVIFFTLNEVIPLDRHFASGQAPIAPEVDQFHNLHIYRLASADHDLGLFSADGKNFVLGDWVAFKLTLKGNDGRITRLAKLLATQNAPVIICSNPRPPGRRNRLDDPFGTVMSIDFQEDTLAFLMQEEQPTPAKAQQRLTVMEGELPSAFAAAYGIKAADGAKFLANADGRHATFAMQADIAKSRTLLESLLGKAQPSDMHADATRQAIRCVEMFEKVRRAGGRLGNLASPEAVVAAFCDGIDVGNGERVQLPFLTGPERERIAARLLLAGDLLRVAEEAVAEAQGPMLSEKDIRRRAQLIATLTMSAAAADSLELKKLRGKKEIIAAVCSTGFTSGPAYPKEVFKAPAIPQRERERIAELLVESEGYLLYRKN